ncbi:hypothetical protein [Nonlabens sp. Asnod3-A02]|uniref:hypothetical protein n=1 Tax=Nonlabens sp. Asnod3-A02 TaxID=3160579 RepID=UPI003866BF6B
MADNYLNLLSTAVYNWAITPTTSGGGYDSTDTTLKPHLDKLAWAGLSQGDFLTPHSNVSGIALTPAWQDLVNRDQVRAQNILNVMLAEFEPASVFTNLNLIKGNLP